MYLANEKVCCIDEENMRKALSGKNFEYKGVPPVFKENYGETLMNRFQKSVAEHYGEGCFHYVIDQTDSQDVGDSLFTFLINELSDCEDCDGQDTAISRLERAIEDIQLVKSHIENLEESDE